MNRLLKFNPLKRDRLTRLLGLTLDGSRLEGVVLRRTNGSLSIEQSFSANLSLDPLTADAELVGREIRNHLDAAEVRESRCVVGLPLKWALTTQVEVPELPEEDVASFLQIEAERGFPTDPATLMVCTSRCRPKGGKQEATLVGIPKTHVSRLEEVLRAAKLKAVSLSLGIAALEPADAGEGVLALVVGESQVGLQITCSGGVAALRTLEGAIEMQGSQAVLHADVVARESRITLGRLPAELRDAVKRIRVYGPQKPAQELADEMELRLEPMGLKVERVASYPPGKFGVQLPGDAFVSSALSLAAAKLVGKANEFEFLPPKVTVWQQLNARYSSGRLRMAGAAAGAVLLILAVLFGYQQVQLMSLRSQWKRMEAQVTELDNLQKQIRQFRPWYDESLRALTILRQVTMAFPDEGSVTAKSVEIHDLNVVTCSGTARNNASLLRVIDQLGKTKGISNPRIVNIRGRSPLQFTLDFQCGEGGTSAN